MFITSVAEMSPELKSDVLSPEWINADLGESDKFLSRSGLLGATCGEQYIRSCVSSLNGISPALCNWPILRCWVFLMDLTADIYVVFF